MRIFNTLISLMFLIFILASLFIGQSIYKSDHELNITRDIYNLTNNISVDYDCEYKYGFNNTTYSLTDLKILRLNNIVCYTGQFFLKTGVEVIKFGVEFGYENPQYDYDFYMNLIKWLIIIIAVSMVLPALVPLCALIYLLFVGIKNIINWLRRRK